MEFNWNLYHEIETKPTTDRTEKEKEIYRYGYQLEEVMSGLDCERE